MSDITKVCETRCKEGEGAWDEWPYPTVTIESAISGKLRARILSVLKRDDSGQPVTLIESQVSGGYSEFTQEDESSIEVKIGEEVVWSDEYCASQESAMASFLSKFTP